MNEPLALTRVTLAACCLLLPPARLAAQCAADASAHLPELEARLDGTLTELDKLPPEQRRTQARRLQERALEELEQVQCARDETAPPETVVRGPAEETPFALVPVLFITDRQPITAPQGKHLYFGSERIASGVSYGRVVVRMPAEDHTPGSPVPLGVSVVTEKDAHAGVTIAAPEKLDRDAFSAQLRQYKQKLPRGAPARVLLFVHGFNVTFTDAMKAVARLSFGLHIDTLPLAISWPSQGSVPKYWNDEENVEPSIERLRPLLQWLLSHPDVDEVILVAHSLGSRLVLRILSELELQKAPLPHLTRIALAAADLNEPEIRELWPRVGALTAKGWLFYTSANDLALFASSIVHSAPPIGDSRKREFVMAPPVETVDASAVAPRLQGYGHGYVIDNPLVRVDLRRWLAQNLPADRRGLTRDTQASLVYWRLHR